MSVLENRPTVSRIPLITFGIPLGLAGLAGVWGAVADALGISRAFGEVFWIASAVAWLWLLVAHTVRGARSRESVLDELRHPAHGPVAALVPVVGMLLGAHLYEHWAIGGVILTVASMVVTALYAGWILSFWFQGNLKLESVHGGYFVPIVSGGLVAAVAAAAIDLLPLAIAALAVGVFAYVVLFGVLAARMALHPGLAAPLLPSLAILVAPPAVAGMGWFAISGEIGGPVGLALAGLTALMALMQLALAPRFVKLPFSIGFWSFTFPYAATTGYTIDWLNATRPAGWEAVVVVLVSAITLFIGSIAVRSILLPVAARRVARAAARQPVTSNVVVFPTVAPVGVPTAA